METNIPLKNIEDLIMPDGKFGFSFMLCASTRAGKTAMMNFLYEKYFKKHATVEYSKSTSIGVAAYLRGRRDQMEAPYSIAICVFAGVNHVHPCERFEHCSAS